MIFFFFWFVPQRETPVVSEDAFVINYFLRIYYKYAFRHVRPTLVSAVSVNVPAFYSHLRLCRKCDGKLPGAE